MGDYAFDLGSYRRPVTTSSPAAQAWFDRGLNWTFGYNHEEAEACFGRALESDPDCAMAYWGIAYVIGPNYNKPWELFDEQEIRETLRRSAESLALARSKMAAASPVEQALIEALDQRYRSGSPVEDLYAAGDAYAGAMREVYARFAEDSEVITLFAEAMMNRTPWNMWDLRSGAPTENADTLECKEVLERGIRRIRERGERPHPGIWHLYVHLMEMSGTPEDALRVGDELRRLVPDAGHLAHMPTHIDVLCGHYQNVVDWNHIGIESDVKYWKYAGAMNFYSLYRVHNYHFKLYGALLLGQFEPAMEAARTMRETIPDELVRMENMADWIESYMSVTTHALVRFGKWQELIDDPLPEDPGLYSMTTALNYYGKGIAHAALRQHEQAKAAQRMFEEAAAVVPETRRMHVVECHDILGVAREMLAGEIEYHHGNHEKAFTHLRKAVENEDNLPYDEPWGWMMPSRHALGALLLEQGRFEEAAECYEADLGLDDMVIRSNRHPNNIWALQGIYRCYTNLGRTREARMIKPSLDIALARADISISTSCFCAHD